MAGTVAMEEAPAMKENSVSAAMRAGLFNHSTKGGRLLQGKAVGEGRRRDPLGVLAPNDTVGNRGFVEKTLDSIKNRVAQQHKSSENQLDLNSNLRPLVSKHASGAPGSKSTFASSKPTVSRNVLGTSAAREPGPIASSRSNPSTFRPISPEKEADVTLPDNQDILKDLELRYGNLIESRAVQKRSTSPLQNRNEQHGLKWTKVTPQPRASAERERFRSPCSPAGSFQRLRHVAGRVETGNGAARNGKNSDAAERTESTTQTSPRTNSQLSPSIAALLHRIQNDLLDDSRGQRVRRSPRVSSVNLFKRRGTPRQHREFRKFGDRDQLSDCKMENSSESNLFDEKAGADMSSAVSIDVSPSRPELRAEVSETDFTANPEVDGNKSTKLTGDCGGESGLAVADRCQVRSSEEARLRARLKSSWEVTTKSRRDLSWSSSNLTYGSEVLLDNEVRKGNTGEMEISNGTPMQMTLEVTGASSHASSSTHCFSDNSLLQKTTAGKAFPSMPRRSSGASTAITCGDGPKPCDDMNSSLSTPQMNGNYSSPANPFVMNSKKSPNSRPSAKVFPKRRGSKLGAPSRVLRTITSDETQGLSDAGAVAPISDNDYIAQRLRQRDSISMQSGPVMETLSGSGLTGENGVDAGRLGSPPWSGMRSEKEPKVRGVFGGENALETAKSHTGFTGSRFEESKTSVSVRSPECSLDADTEDGTKDAKQPIGATARAESEQRASIEVLPKNLSKEDKERAEIRSSVPAVGNKLKVKSTATEAVRARGCDTSSSRSMADNGLRGRPTSIPEAVGGSLGRAPAIFPRAGHGVLNKLQEPNGEGQAPREVASRPQLLSSTSTVRSTGTHSIGGKAGDSARRSEIAGPRPAEQLGVLSGRIKSTSDVPRDVEKLAKSTSIKNLNGVTIRKPSFSEHEKDSKARNGRQATLVTDIRERAGRGDALLRAAELGSKKESMNEAISRDHVDLEQNEEKGGDATGMSVSDGLTSLSLEKTEMMEISHDELPSHDVVNSKTAASSSANLSCTLNSHSTNAKIQENSQVSAPPSGLESGPQQPSREAQSSLEQDRARKSNEMQMQSSGFPPRDPSPRFEEMPQAARSTPSEEKNAGANAAATSETAKNVASVKPVAATASSKRITENSQFVWVNNKRYQKLGKIGKGGSSEVYKVIDSECNIYALKKISLKGREPSIARSFYQEIEYLETLSGKRNVVQLVAFEVTNTAVIAEDYQEKICDDACIYMVLEYGEIDLAGILSKKRKHMQENGDALDDNWLRFYWELMLLAVKTIHDERIVHADLKPANFLLVKGELKLIDFGIAKAIQNDTTHIVRDSQVGTVNYMSPEAFMTNTTDEEGRKVKCGRASDIWSLGCILYQMVYGRLPFSNIDSFYARIHAITNKDTKIDFPPVKNVWLLDCMKRCLTWDRYSRPHISDLLEHPFLQPENASQYSLISK